MKLRLLAVALGLVGVLALGAFAVGCGGDDDSDTTTASEENEAADEGSATTTTGAAGGGQTLKIEMGEFYYKPKDATAKAGTVTINAPNVGKEPHELVLAKSDDDPAELPTLSDGSVDEESLDVPGEVEEVEAGATGTATLDLDAANYVMFCNLPGHYQSGMYGSLTVD